MYVRALCYSTLEKLILSLRVLLLPSLIALLSQGIAPIHLAVNVGSVEIVKYLLDSGVNVSAVAVSFRTVIFSLFSRLVFFLFLFPRSTFLIKNIF